MLLKRMTLSKFRQFNGTQMIEFSCDNEKNVTVVMGTNGSGKTTLAQAFTWCLYGETDFEDKDVLNKKVAQEIGPNGEEKVEVKIDLIHQNREYTMIREQKYTTDSKGKLKKANNTVFKIAYKADDGQREFVKENETELTMKEILPKELSRYFFFDGERIGNMSKEIKRGKSKEFAEAVKRLLGLSAFSTACEHLNGRGANTVIKSYDRDFNSESDEKIGEYGKEISKLEKSLNDISAKLQQKDTEINLARDKEKEYEQKLQENKSSEQLAVQRVEYQKNKKSFERTKDNDIEEALAVFNTKAGMWMSKRLMHDALKELAEAKKVDVGIPFIHAKTIEFLIERGKCICGNCIKKGDIEYKELTELLEYIPPKSIGTLIGEFVKDCRRNIRDSSNVFDEIQAKYTFIREHRLRLDEIQAEIDKIEEQLSTMTDTAELQKKYVFYREQFKKLDREKNDMIKQQGEIESDLKRKQSARNDLVLQDKSNRKIARLRAYALYMYNYLSEIYQIKETETREKLEKTVNEIFKGIYNGGFSLKIDEKYNVQIIVDDYAGIIDDIEASTAQSISVIFAFIAGVIKLARENEDTENEMLTTEAYPLVMDAPLSAFDKTRIKTVCEALPKVAEQVIIFIKDTDGEIAEENMGEKVGKRYSFIKKNEFETELTGR